MSKSKFLVAVAVAVAAAAPDRTGPPTRLKEA